MKLLVSLLILCIVGLSSGRSLELTIDGESVVLPREFFPEPSTVRCVPHCRPARRCRGACSRVLYDHPLCSVIKLPPLPDCDGLTVYENELEKTDESATPGPADVGPNPPPSASPLGPPPLPPPPPPTTQPPIPPPPPPPRAIDEVSAGQQSLRDWMQSVEDEMELLLDEVNELWKRSRQN